MKTNAPLKIAAGLATLVLLAGFTLGGQPTHQPVPSVTVTQVVAPLTSAELPQDQVRDMSYN